MIKMVANPLHYFVMITQKGSPNARKEVGVRRCFLFYDSRIPVCVETRNFCVGIVYFVSPN